MKDTLTGGTRAGFEKAVLSGPTDFGSQETVRDHHFDHFFHNPMDNRCVVNGGIIRQTMQRFFLIAELFCGVLSDIQKYARVC